MPIAPEPPAAGERGFPARARIKRQADFDVVFREGRKVVIDSLVAWIRPTPEGIGCSRLGLAVGRRVGGAIARNRCKRLLRDAFRHLSAGIPTPLDMVFVPRPASPLRRAADARRAVPEVLARYAAGPRKGAGGGRRRRRS